MRLRVYGRAAEPHVRFWRTPGAPPPTRLQRCRRTS